MKIQKIQKLHMYLANISTRGDCFHVQVHSGVNKNTPIKGSVTEREGYIGATFGVNSNPTFMS